MYILLYNPLSAKNTGIKKYEKLCKKFKKKNIEYIGYNILDFNGREMEFALSLKEDDIVVIIGGDGTLSQVINKIRGINIKNRVFFCRAGSGNDYCRDHKGNYFEITHELKTFPKVIANGKEGKFINGVGMGIDAAVCDRVNANHKKGIEESYYKSAIKVFKNFKQFPITITIDGQEKKYDKVWFAAIQNGKYFGGGMKIAPKAERLDEYLDIYIIEGIKLFKLLLIFPLIFIGKHIWFKKYVHEFRGKHIILESLVFDKVQRDGEVLDNINKIEVRR